MIVSHCETVTQLDKILKKAEEEWEARPESPPSSIQDAQGQISELQARNEELTEQYLEFFTDSLYILLLKTCVAKIKSL